MLLLEVVVLFIAIVVKNITSNAPSNQTTFLVVVAMDDVVVGVGVILIATFVSDSSS